jgi:hypothetical protein
MQQMRRIPTVVAWSVWAVVAGAWMIAADASAQTAAGGPQAAVLQINQQAMAMYGDLRFAEAKQLLQQAETMCNQYAVRGQPLARTYANMGIVEAGGLGNNAGALDYFRKALCQDRTIMLDPLSTTPDIQMLFNAAQGQVAAPGACQGAAIAPVPPPPTYPQPVPQPPTYPQPTYPQPQPTYPQPQPPSAASQIMRHTPLTQQARMVPIPVFTEVNPNVTVGQIVLFYRTTGERIYQQVQMQKSGAGYAATIGCDVLTTLEPIGIEYYIAVLDPASKLLGTAGTEAQPYQISIVDTLTVVPPSIPNEPPPSACVAECPPWNPECNKGCKQLGDMCDNSGECCSGMTCVEEMCTASEGGDDGGGGGDGNFKMRFRMSINGGIGFGLITGGAEKPYNQVSSGDLKVGTGFALSKFHLRANPMFNIPAVNGLAVGLMFRGDIPLESYSDVAAVSKNRAKVWGLEPSLLVGVSYRLVGADNDTGFQLLFQGFFGWMNILHRVQYKDCTPVKGGTEDWDDDDTNGNQTKDGFTYKEGELICNQDNVTDQGWNGEDWKGTHFFRNAGPVGIELGLDGYYWFVNNFGINFGLDIDLPFPKFALNIDVQAGLAFQF